MRNVLFDYTTRIESTNSKIKFILITLNLRYIKALHITVNRSEFIPLWIMSRPQHLLTRLKLIYFIEKSIFYWVCK